MSIIRKISRSFFSAKYLGFIQGHNYLDQHSLGQIKELIGKTDSPIRDDFENNFASYVGKGRAVSFAAARMGFYSLMKVLNIGKGDEVIIQGHTCSVMPNAIFRIGAKPVYADIDHNTFGSSASKIKNLISSKTKMIIAQHSFGIPCNIEPIVKLAKAKEIFLLEDCAITFDSKINNVEVGNFGDASLFSFDHSKPINTLIGGIIYTRNNQIYNLIKDLQNNSEELSYKKQISIWKQIIFERNYYNSQKYGRSFIINKINKALFHRKNPFFTDDNSKSVFSNYPYPAKMPIFLTKLGLYELERWKFEKKRRQNLLIQFLDFFKLNGLDDFLPSSYYNSKLEIIPLRFVYTHPYADKIKKKLSSYLDINWFWFQMPIIECTNPSDLDYLNGSCPISEKVCKEIINIPCVQNDFDTNYLFNVIKKAHL